VANWNSLLDGLNAATVSAFGREVVYISAVGNSAPLSGIFQSTQQSEEASPGVYAVLFLRLADLPLPPQCGDEVLVDDAAYKVFAIEADCGGGAVLRLRQV
jgi:hypothetical protein